MTIPTDVQLIRDDAGIPEYAVIPFKLFQKLIGNVQADTVVPHDVVGKITMENKSAVQAWREYLQLTQQDIAERMGITQAAYSQMENAKKIRKGTASKIASAMHINVDLLYI